MYISCYDSYETNFNHNGRFKVFVDEAGENNIYRVLNGQFYCTVEVSKNDEFSKYIQKRMIVKLPTPNKTNKFQLFRLLDYVEEDNSIVWTGYHIAWDLVTGHIRHINMIDMTRKEACEYILEKAKEAKNHRFIIKEVESNSERQNLQIVRKNPLAALIGSENNTVLNRFNNTEFDFDNFNIQLYNRLGKNTGFLIKEEKNIITHRKEFESKNIITRLIIQGADELLLPEYYVDSPKINDYDEVFYGHIVLNEIGVDEENGITEELAIIALRQAAYDLFELDHIDEESLSWTITFDDGQDNDKLPAELKELLKLDIGDTVSVKLKESNHIIKSRILEYNYNFVTGKFVDATIGGVAQAFTSKTSTDITLLNEKVDLLSFNVTTATNEINTNIAQNNLDLNIVKTNISDLSTAVKDFDSGIDSNTKDIAALLDLIIDLEDIIGGTSEDLVSIQQRIKVINENTVQLGLRLDELEHQVIEMKETVDKVIDHEERLILIEEKIEELIKLETP
nr:MAG TPA: tail protein [Caudoviricetes sp.]